MRARGPRCDELESVLGATPHEFESRILRQMSSPKVDEPNGGAPARRSRLRVALTVGAALVLLGVGAVAGTALLRPRHDHSGDLRRLLVPAPADSRPWEQPIGTDEQLSLDGYAALRWQGVDEQLRRLGYQRGAVRCWVLPSGALVDVALLRFDSGVHAAQYVEVEKRTFTSGYTDGSAAPVPDVPGGALFAGLITDSDGYRVAIAIAARGDVMVEVVVARRAELDPSVINRLMREQYDRL